MIASCATSRSFFDLLEGVSVVGWWPHQWRGAINEGVCRCLRTRVASRVKRVGLGPPIILTKVMYGYTTWARHVVGEVQYGPMSVHHLGMGSGQGCYIRYTTCGNAARLAITLVMGYMISRDARSGSL